MVIMQNKKSVSGTGTNGYTKAVYLTTELKEINADVFVNVKVIEDSTGKYIRIDRG